MNPSLLVVLVELLAWLERDLTAPLTASFTALFTFPYSNYFFPVFFIFRRRYVIVPAIQGLILGNILRILGFSLSDNMAVMTLALTTAILLSAYYSHIPADIRLDYAIMKKLAEVDVEGNERVYVITRGKVVEISEGDRGHVELDFGSLFNSGMEVIDLLFHTHPCNHTSPSPIDLDFPMQPGMIVTCLSIGRFRIPLLVIYSKEPFIVSDFRLVRAKNVGGYYVVRRPLNLLAAVTPLPLQSLLLRILPVG